MILKIDKESAIKKQEGGARKAGAAV